MKTRAAVLHHSPVKAPYAQSRPLVIEEVELAAPGPDEVLVKIQAAGLCHSDLSVIDGARPRPTPMVLGHEATGVVEQCGALISDLRPGDRVVMVFVPSCGHCLACNTGRPALCEPGNAANGEGTLLSHARRLSLGGKSVHHHLGISAFAEHAVVHRRSLIKLDADLPPEIAALFGCAVLTGVGAAVNTARIQPGESAAIVGLGGVGLACLLGARACGAGPIIAVDLNEDKLRLATELGADYAIKPTATDATEQIKSWTQGGVDHAIEMAGSVKALEFAWEITRRGGNTVTAGLAPPTQMLSISPVKLVAEERTLKGSYVGSCIPTRDIPRFIKLYQAGKLPVDKLLSSTGPLDDINQAFDQLAAGRINRHVILM